MTAIEVIVALIVGVVGAAAGYFVGYNNRKKTAEAQIGSAEAEATRLVNEAIKWPPACPIRGFPIGG